MACDRMRSSPQSPSTSSISLRIAATLSSDPVERSSSTRTKCPRATNAAARCEPMKPAPPVTRQRTIALGKAGDYSEPRSPPPARHGLGTRTCLVPEPGDEALEAFLDADRGRVPQHRPRAADVGVSDVHVARPLRLEAHLGLLAERAAEVVQQFQETDRTRLTQVVDSETWIAIERLEHTVQDVIDIRV